MTSFHLPDPGFILLVQGSPIHCSRRIIASSSLFLDMVELVADPSPIPIPNFISRQIMLDLVEMTESGDWECAHLILVSLSYLLDFLIAVDFLGCERLKTVIAEKVKEKISDSNWSDVLLYTKNILGLDTTVKHTMEYLCTRLGQLAVEKDILPMECDPYHHEYEQFTPDLIKLMIKSDCLRNCLGFGILKNWVRENSEKEAEICEILLLIQYKDLSDNQVEEIVSEVKTWKFGVDFENKLNELVNSAKIERELERSMMNKQQTMHTLYRIHHERTVLQHQDMFFEIPGGPDVFFEL